MDAPTRPPAATRVVREVALDPRTGLPVARFVGPHPPTLRPGDPAPAGAWRVLRVEERDGAWVVDLETSAAARRFADVAASVDDEDVEEVLAVLDDAARLGTVHGALGPEHLWRHGAGVRVEGFGVGWGAPTTADADRAAAARALLALPATAISTATRDRLRALAGPAAPVDAGLAGPAEPLEAAPAGPSTPPVPTTPSPAAAPPTAAPTATFVKAPPPGARVRSGSTPLDGLPRRVAAAAARAGASPEGRRRLLLVAGLVVGVALLASLSVALQRRPTVADARASGAPTTVATAYVVDVQVRPDGLPPARLVVLESPPGSRLAPGTVVGSVPRLVQLDRAGTWRFEARFLDRRSAPATLDLPDERQLVLVFPDPAPAAP